MTRTIALITGASSGIGEAFCRALAVHCSHIIAIAPCEKRLQKLYETLAGEAKVLPVVADLSTVDGVSRAVEMLRQQGPVDYLVNNAGYGRYACCEDSSIDEQLKMMHLQLDASVRLCRAALPGMLSVGRGGIVNVAPVGALRTLPISAIYDACKAFVSSFSLSLQQEVGNSGIRVQCLCPGLTHSEFDDRADFEKVDKTELPLSTGMTPTEIVDCSLAALAHEPIVVMPGKFTR